MNAKHRMTVIFSMLSLTVLMLFFQNCSPQGSGLFSDGSVTDGFVTSPPIVFTSSTSACSVPTATFTSSQTIYVCVQNAGVAPLYCHSAAGAACTNYVTLSASQGWNSSTGIWYRAYPGGSFGAGFSYTAMAWHTDDHSSSGQYTFTVYP